MNALLQRFSSVVVPAWARWLAVALLAIASYGMGRLHEARRGADALATYQANEAAHVVTVVKREVQVVHDVEYKYRDRIRTITVQGENLENLIPSILPPATDRRLPLPAGFVRILDAAWSGAPAGPAVDADAEPSPVPPSVVAENETDNATSCRKWREQALGWREFYAKQQVAINGKAGSWAGTAADAAQQ